jgi:hypothetical protein
VRCCQRWHQDLALCPCSASNSLRSDFNTSSTVYLNDVTVMPPLHYVCCSCAPERHSIFSCTVRSTISHRCEKLPTDDELISKRVFVDCPTSKKQAGNGTIEACVNARCEPAARVFISLQVALVERNARLSSNCICSICWWICFRFVVQQVVGLVESCGFFVDLWLCCTTFCRAYSSNSTRSILCGFAVQLVVQHIHNKSNKWSFSFTDAVSDC